MFDEKVINDMVTIDKLVSAKNNELHKNGSTLFLSWTFPTNHSHELMIKTSYFVIWTGETGKGKLVNVCFGPIRIIEKLLTNINEIKLNALINERKA